MNQKLQLFIGYTESTSLMVDALIQIFSDVLEVHPDMLNDESSSESVRQWDSLASMHLAVAIEDRFKVTLSSREIMRMSTIGLARKVLKEKNVNV